jgi:hypothetical protein
MVQKSQFLTFPSNQYLPIGAVLGTCTSLILIGEFLIFAGPIALQALFRKGNEGIRSDFACSAAMSANDD